MTKHLVGYCMGLIVLIGSVNAVSASTSRYQASAKDRSTIQRRYGIIDQALQKNPAQQQVLIDRITTLQASVAKVPSINRYLQSLLDHIKAWKTSGSSTTGSTNTGTTQTSNTSTISPRIGSCTIMPVDNPWNTDISQYPVHSNSANYIASINASRKTLHPDFGANRDGGPFGIPYVIVGTATPLVPVNAIWYPEESDVGNFPVPLDAPTEKGGDKHVIAIDQDGCKLYEIYAAARTSKGREGGSVAVFDLRSNALRPDGRTSADAAGLPIFPGLVRYDEVAAGQINHALRFTVSKSQKAYINPATHYASSSTDPNLPPMGLRLRLKASYDISKVTGQARVILEALKKYGMIVADNGSDRYISGAPDARRDDDDLGQLKRIPGSAFEAVETGPLHK